MKAFVGFHIRPRSIIFLFKGVVDVDYRELRAP
jgi:hypothetical protein